MTTGLALGIVGVILLVGWLVADGYLKLTGKQTFTQWVIAKSKINKTFAWAMTALLVVGPMFLFFHFELPKTITSKRSLLDEQKIHSEGSWVCSSCIPSGPPEPSPGECEEPLAFTGSTLWKPKGDHSGALVVLLAEQHDYESCSAKRRDGSWEELSYTGRSNGNRQTWRGDYPGGPQYAGKRDGGGVLCDSSCFFPIPGAPKKRWE